MGEQEAGSWGPHCTRGTRNAHGTRDMQTRAHGNAHVRKARPAHTHTGTRTHVHKNALIHKARQHRLTQTCGHTRHAWAGASVHMGTAHVSTPVHTRDDARSHPKTHHMRSCAEGAEGAEGPGLSAEEEGVAVRRQKPGRVQAAGGTGHKAGWPCGSEVRDRRVLWGQRRS